MEDFYNRLKCWRDYSQKRDAELKEIVESANKVVNNNQSQKQQDGTFMSNMRANSQGAKKRPTTAVVAGAKNLRTLQA